MALGCRLVVSVLLMLAAACTAGSRETQMKLNKDNRALIAISSPYDFSADGRVEFSISDLQIWHHPVQGLPDPDPKRMGFFITTSEAQALLDVDVSQGKCALDTDNVVILLTLDMVDQHKVEESVYEVALQDKIAGYQGGEHSIFFANCESLMVKRGAAVSMGLRMELFYGKRDRMHIGDHSLKASRSGVASALAGWSAGVPIGSRSQAQPGSRPVVLTDQPFEHASKRPSDS